MRRLLALMMGAASLGAVAQVDWELPYNPDGNNDGYVNNGDLLDLLAVYGQQFNADELLLSEDSSSVIVYVGDLNKMLCAVACQNLSGSWTNLGWEDLIKHYAQLELPPVFYSNDTNEVFMWMLYVGESTGFAESPNPFAMRSVPRNTYAFMDDPIKPAFHDYGSYGIASVHECWCVTKQRPRVEWYRILEDEWEENKDQLSQDGWMLHSAEGDKVFFWRWAE